jgi:hypothetical protein
MNSKRIIGLLMAALGVMGVIYTAAVFTAGSHHHTVMRIVYIVLGLIIAISGIKMVRATREEA